MSKTCIICHRLCVIKDETIRFLYVSLSQSFYLKDQFHIGQETCVLCVLLLVEVLLVEQGIS